MLVTATRDDFAAGDRSVGLGPSSASCASPGLRHGRQRASTWWVSN